MCVRVETLARELGKLQTQHTMMAGTPAAASQRPALDEPDHGAALHTPVQTTRRLALLPVGGWSFSPSRWLRGAMRQQ